MSHHSFIRSSRNHRFDYSAQLLFSVIILNTNKKHSHAKSFQQSFQTHSKTQQTLCLFGGSRNPVFKSLVTHRPPEPPHSPDLFSHSSSNIPFLTIPSPHEHVNTHTHTHTHRPLRSLTHSQKRIGCWRCRWSEHWWCDSWWPWLTRCSCCWPDSSVGSQGSGSILLALSAILHKLPQSFIGSQRDRHTALEFCMTTDS